MSVFTAITPSKVHFSEYLKTENKPEDEEAKTDSPTPSAPETK